MDLNRLDMSSATPAATTDTTMDREALENILGMTQLQGICVMFRHLSWCLCWQFIQAPDKCEKD